MKSLYTWILIVLVYCTTYLCLTLGTQGTPPGHTRQISSSREPQPVLDRSPTCNLPVLGWPASEVTMAVFAPLFVYRVASSSSGAPCVWAASSISKARCVRAATSRFFGLRVRVGSEVATIPRCVRRAPSSSLEASCVWAASFSPKARSVWAATASSDRESRLP